MKEEIRIESWAVVVACAIPFADTFHAVVLAVVSASLALIGGELAFHEISKGA